MPSSSEPPDVQQPPDWAVDQATDELGEGDDAGIADHAWEIVRDAETLEAERHDEYDDPDEGGEG